MSLAMPIPPNGAWTEDSSHEPGDIARDQAVRPHLSPTPWALQRRCQDQRKSEPQRGKMDDCGSGQHGRSESTLTQGEADGQTVMADCRLAFPSHSFGRDLLSRGYADCPDWCRRTTEHHPPENRNNAV